MHYNSTKYFQSNFLSSTTVCYTIIISWTEPNEWTDREGNSFSAETCYTQKASQEKGNPVGLDA